MRIRSEFPFRMFIDCFRKFSDRPHERSRHKDKGTIRQCCNQSKHLGPPAVARTSEMSGQGSKASLLSIIMSTANRYCNSNCERERSSELAISSFNLAPVRTGERGLDRGY